MSTTPNSTNSPTTYASSSANAPCTTPLHQPVVSLLRNVEEDLTLTNFSAPGNERYQCFQRKLPVTMRRFFDENRDKLQLDIYAGHDGMGRCVVEKSLNRPALALIGYFKHFAKERIQFFGTGEMSYLHDLELEKQEEALEKIACENPPGILVSTCDLNNLAALKKVGDKHGIPVLRSRIESRDLFPAATICIESAFALRGTMHATLVSVCGIGVLICGSSGIGKSECALALLERGHSLVADDIVEITPLDGVLRGSAKRMGRAMLECRGLGIINVLDLFGARAFIQGKSIEMVVELLCENSPVEEKRSQETNRMAEIFGVRIPHYIIKVRPGREISHIVEVAAMTRVREKTGCEPGTTFNERLIQEMRAHSNENAH